jgi:hypothetical protein
VVIIPAGHGEKDDRLQGKNEANRNQFWTCHSRKNLFTTTGLQDNRRLFKRHYCFLNGTYIERWQAFGRGLTFLWQSSLVHSTPGCIFQVERQLSHCLSDAKHLPCLDLHLQTQVVQDVKKELQKTHTKKIMNL